MHVLKFICKQGGDNKKLLNEMVNRIRRCEVELLTAQFSGRDTMRNSSVPLSREKQYTSDPAVNSPSQKNEEPAGYRVDQ
jgi:hypothetical protein